jgi:phosphoglycolate phosphatase-like HAD superfamily hydrolase
MKKPVIFLDDGGVLNDNTVRGPQWQQRVAEYFAPRLGGAPEAWAEANKVVIDQVLEAQTWETLMREAPHYAAFEREYYRLWLTGMCNRVGVPAPAPEACLALGLAAEDFVIPHVRSAYPGVVDAVRALRAAGYTLHTASGSSSRTLALYLDGMGVRACFGRLYGPDLIDTFKNGPAFAAGILADLGLPAAEALFLDDSRKALSWAAQSGAGTLLVSTRQDTDGINQIGSLAELPAWLERAG